MASTEQEKLRRLERFARLLDSAFRVPGTDFRIGLDGLAGLFTGVGDTAGALAASYIIAAAARLGAPRPVLLKMALNVAFDAVLGTIPLVGDIFDFTWKANQRNVRLLEDYLHEPRKTVAVSGLFVAGLCILLLAFIGLIAALWFLLLRWLWQAAGG
jgi:hypothetical protein